jgi:hypothetical protein
MIYILEKKLIQLSNERVEKKILDLILRSEDLIYNSKIILHHIFKERITIKPEIDTFLDFIDKQSIIFNTLSKKKLI